MWCLEGARDERPYRGRGERELGVTVALSEDVREIEIIDEMEASAPVVVEPGAVDDLGTLMRVRKRDGSLEAVDLNKIVRAVARAAPRVSSTSTP
ncbi:MAG: hypothetical protein V9E94_13915 [Microthrixaceae bacterium]